MSLKKDIEKITTTIEDINAKVTDNEYKIKLFDARLYEHEEHIKQLTQEVQDREETTTAPTEDAETTTMATRDPCILRGYSAAELGRDLIEKVKSRNTAAVEALLQTCGSETWVNAKDDNRMTALHWAGEKGAVEAARLLLQHGADLES